MAFKPSLGGLAREAPTPDEHLPDSACLDQDALSRSASFSLERMSSPSSAGSGLSPSVSTSGSSSQHQKALSSHPVAHSAISKPRLGKTGSGPAGSCTRTSSGNPPRAPFAPISANIVKHRPFSHQRQAGLDGCSLQYPSAPASPLTPAPSPTPTRVAPEWPAKRDGEGANPQMATEIFGLLDDKGQRALLENLLDRCSLAQLSHLYSYIAPKLRRDPFSALPDELCIQILSATDALTLSQAALVSRRWNKLCSDDTIWEALCEKYEYLTPSNCQPEPGPDGLAKMSRLVSSQLPLGYIDHMSGTSLQPAGPSRKGFFRTHPRQKPAKSFRSQFEYQYSVDAAWKSGGISKVIHCTPNTVVVTNVHISDNNIIVTRDNSDIHVFDLNGSNMREFKGHTAGVWAMDLRDNTLVTGGCDRDIRVWEMDTGVSTHVMSGHSSTVRCISFVDEDTIVSGSRDATLRVWNIKTGACSRVLSGHNGSVRCLAVHGGKVASGAYDQFAKLWDISDGTLQQTFHGHSSHIYAIVYDGTHVITGCLDTTIRVWDPQTGQCKNLLQGHTSLVGHLRLRGSTLVSGGSEGSVRVWSLERPEPIKRIAAHDNSVISLEVTEKRMVTGGSDGRVRVWDPRTGNLIRELGEPSSSIWRVAFTTERAVVFSKRNQDTVMELWSFAPERSGADSRVGEAVASV